MSDRINDSEMNADKRELAALHQGIADLKSCMLRHAAAGERLDKIMLVICLSIAAVAIIGFAILTFCPASPRVTFTYAAQPVEGATRQRDRDALGASAILRVLDEDSEGWSIETCASQMISYRTEADLWWKCVQ